MARLRHYHIGQTILLAYFLNAFNFSRLEKKDQKYQLYSIPRKKYPINTASRATINSYLLLSIINLSADKRRTIKRIC